MYLGDALSTIPDFRESTINNLFREAQLVGNALQGIMFGDTAFSAAWTHARGLFKGANLEHWQVLSNNIMSPVRTGAEWPFGLMNQSVSSNSKASRQFLFSRCTHF